MTDKKNSTEPPPQGWVECSGDIIPADHIRFGETVWRRGKRAGFREVVAEVLDVEGPGGDDWITCQGIGCEGEFPDEVSGQFRRKRRNIERNEPIRRLWTDEETRKRLAELG